MSSTNLVLNENNLFFMNFCFFFSLKQSARNQIFCFNVDYNFNFLYINSLYKKLLYIYKTALTVDATIDASVDGDIVVILVVVSFLLIHSFLLIKNNIIKIGSWINENRNNLRELPLSDFW